MPQGSEQVTISAQAKEDLLRAIESKAVRCGVIGLGFIGSVLMDGLIDAGLEAHGHDRSEHAVHRFNEWIPTRHAKPARRYSASSSAKAVLDCDVVFVAVRNLIENGTLDEEPLESAVRVLQKQTRRPRVIILESTVTPGSTRRFARELGAGPSDGTFVAHAPERLSAGHDSSVLRKTPHLVGGVDGGSTEVAGALLRRICDTVVPVSSPEVSELSKLLENAFLSVNIGLVNEITRLSLSLGIEAQEVCEAAATKPFGYLPFYPGPGVGGHCLPNDLWLLANTARSYGWNPELLDGAITVNDHAPCLIVDRLGQLLKEKGRELRGATILLVGVGFKPGSADTTLSPALTIVRALRDRGAAPCFLDSRVPHFEVDGIPVPARTPAEITKGAFSAVTILSGDDQLKPKTLAGVAEVLLDASGRRKGSGLAKEFQTL